jgi:hypothetical protein
MSTGEFSRSNRAFAGRTASLLTLFLGLALTRLATAAPFQYGPDDFRISSQGGSGNPAFIVANVASAYNPVANEYLVVWRGIEAVSSLSAIYGQRIDAASGAEVGVDFQISASEINVLFPSVAFNSTANEYLVVWVTNDGVRGQRLSAAGAQVGDDDFHIGSSTGFDHTGLAYNPTSNQYLVVWMNAEVTGQLLNGSGVEVAPDDFTISQASISGRRKFGPAVAYGSTRNEYLVVWRSEDDPQLADSEFEIFCQRVGTVGTLPGVNERVSDMGGLGDPAFRADNPAVAYDSADDQFLVVWNGNDTTTNFEIYGQRLAYIDPFGLVQIGANDFRLSAAGTPAFFPALVYNAARNEYVAAWGGKSTSDSEIAIQRLTHLGVEVGPDDIRVSDMGSGSAAFDASSPALAVGPGTRLLVAWKGDDNVGGLVDDELEIFGQLLDLNLIFADGLESGDFSAWAFKQP